MVHGLPGYSTRPAAAEDAPTIHALLVSCGSFMTVDAVAADLGRPTVQPAFDTILAFADASGRPRLVGWAWVNLGRRAQIDVDPAWRGRGLGTLLLCWAEDRARALGSGRLGQNVLDADGAAGELLSAHGYAAKAASWELVIDLPAGDGAAEVPGISVRPFRHRDERATYEMMERAFADWQERPRAYAEWAQQTVGHEMFAPRMSPLAFDGDRLVGAVLSLDRPASPDGYVERVAVDHGYRGRGIARALLSHAFQEFHRNGRRSCALWTHSDTGALPVYERLGMRVRRTSTHYSRALA